jgi:cell division protein FtsI/penicillin-binding protein 2
LISQYATVDKDDFMKRATKANDVYEEILHRVDPDVAQSITNLALPGVGLIKESWRSYPGGIMASHELGLVGEKTDGTMEGKYGLERSYDDELARKSAGSSASVFAQLFDGLRSTTFGVDSGNIDTTIEPTVEKYLEKTLANTSAEWHPDEIGGIVMDPTSGAILAMSSLPTFDANDLSNIKDAKVLSNPLVEHVYEMGSIVKPLTMAMALDTGAEKPDSLYEDVGTMTLNGKKIANFDGRARGVIPMQEILSQSLNIGAATIALKTEKDSGTGTMLAYFSKYGFSDKTDVDLPNEATGLIGNLKPGPSLRDISIATAAYGQGIAISPIETVRALSILANGGVSVKPHIVSSIELADGTVKNTDFGNPGKGQQVIKKESADEVTKMLVKVVDTALKKGAIKMDHYSIAAKTGTAQIPDHVNGGYYPDKYLHSFFGYFPAYNPKFIVFLYQIYPKGAQYASETLTDPFADMAKFLINYYDVPPDR